MSFQFWPRIVSLPDISQRKENKSYLNLVLFLKAFSIKAFYYQLPYQIVVYIEFAECNFT